MPMPKWPTTPWSKILRLHEDDPVKAQDALSQILMVYYQPIRQYMACHASAQDAEDWANDFAARMMEKNLPGRAQVGHHFRNYLSASLRNYVMDQYRKGKRDPLAKAADPEVLERIGNAERVFNREWGTLLIQRALDRLGKEPRGANEPSVSPEELLMLRLKYGLVEDGRSRSYKDICKELGKELENHTIDNALRRTKKALLGRLREEVEQLTATENQVDEELWEISKFL